MYGRYRLQIHARTLALPEFNEEAQERVERAHLLVIGAGGLASCCLPQLVTQGVGALTLVDDDTVSFSNLPRQILFTPQHVGQPKVDVARERLQQWAPQVKINTCKAHFPLVEEPWLQDTASMTLPFTMALDCSDNLATSLALNDYCAKYKLPLLWAGVEGYQGQISLLHAQKGITLQDIVAAPSEPMEEPPQAIFAPLVQAMGSLMVAEVIKYLVGFVATLDGYLLHLNIKEYALQRFAVHSSSTSLAKEAS